MRLRVLSLCIWLVGAASALWAFWSSAKWPWPIDQAIVILGMIVWAASTLSYWFPRSAENISDTRRLRRILLTALFACAGILLATRQYILPDAYSIAMFVILVGLAFAAIGVSAFSSSR
jgi:hypothetical protein